MRKSFRYRLYPTKAQATKLAATLVECRWLYNKLLEERKVAWETQRKSISLYAQHMRLPQLKDERPSLGVAHAQVLQNVGLRLEHAFRAFFRRAKAGETPGYPRFKGAGRCTSFTFPQAPRGCGMKGKRLYISKIGHVKVALHRPIEGEIKTATIRRRPTGKWFVIFSCEVGPCPLPFSNTPVGIDMGLTTFAALSNGEKIENPRFFHRDEKAIARAQRRMDKARKGSTERTRQHRTVARIYERSTCRRRDFAHKAARSIINRFGFVAVEALDIEKMASSRRFAKSIRDAAWSIFFALLACKAEWAGRTRVAVNPAYTSQDCSRCGQRQLMPLTERVYRCPSCGLELDRDHNAALNILAAGMRSLGASPESPCRVTREHSPDTDVAPLFM